MKKLSFFLLAVIISACGANQSRDNVREQISEYKNDIVKINTTISELERSLEENDSNSEEDSRQLVKVSVQDVKHEKFDHFFVVNGSVEAVNEAFISPEINGQIKQIHVDEGSRVRKGQLLISLNSTVIENGIAEVETALELAKIVYKKQKELWDQKIGSEIQYLEAKTNKESLEKKLATLKSQLDMARIKAPIDGIIDGIFKKEGELAVPGVQLIQLINLKKVYVNAEVSEAYLPLIKKGDPVSVLFPSFPGMEVDTKIHRTGNVVNPLNRTFKIQVKINNNNEKLKPNIIAMLKLKDFSADSAFIVPSMIIKKDVNGDYLYIAEREQGKMIAKKTYIKAGMSQNDKTVVEKGLQNGQKVIVNGFNIVNDGLEITISNN